MSNDRLLSKSYFLCFSLIFLFLLLDDVKLLEEGLTVLAAVGAVQIDIAGQAANADLGRITILKQIPSRFIVNAVPYRLDGALFDVAEVIGSIGEIAAGGIASVPVDDSAPP